MASTGSRRQSPRSPRSPRSTHAPRQAGLAQRNRRVADQIQREISALLRTEVKDPRIGMLTLTGVDVTPDYAHAKIRFTTLASGAARDEILRGLRRSAGFLRSLLGRRIKLHTTPELHFEYDESVERGFRLTQLIDEAVASQSQPDADDVNGAADEMPGAAQNPRSS